MDELSQDDALDAGIHRRAAEVARRRRPQRVPAHLDAAGHLRGSRRRRRTRADPPPREPPLPPPSLGHGELPDLQGHRLGTEGDRPARAQPDRQRRDEPLLRRGTGVPLESVPGRSTPSPTASTTSTTPTNGRCSAPSARTSSTSPATSSTGSRPARTAADRGGRDLGRAAAPDPPRRRDRHALLGRDPERSGGRDPPARRGARPPRRRRDRPARRGRARHLRRQRLRGPPRPRRAGRTGGAAPCCAPPLPGGSTRLDRRPPRRRSSAGTRAGRPTSSGPSTPSPRTPSSSPASTNPGTSRRSACPAAGGGPGSSTIPFLDAGRPLPAEIARLVAHADLVGTVHPGERAPLVSLAPERAPDIVPVDLAIGVNRHATADPLVGVAAFGEYVLVVRRFPAGGPRPRPLRERRDAPVDPPRPLRRRGRRRDVADLRRPQHGRAAGEPERRELRPARRPRPGDDRRPAAGPGRDDRHRVDAARRPRRRARRLGRPGPRRRRERRPVVPRTSASCSTPSGSSCSSPIGATLAGQGRTYAQAKHGDIDRLRRPDGHARPRTRLRRRPSPGADAAGTAQVPRSSAAIPSRMSRSEWTRLVVAEVGAITSARTAIPPTITSARPRLDGGAAPPLRRRLRGTACRANPRPRPARSGRGGPARSRSGRARSRGRRASRSCRRPRPSGAARRGRGGGRAPRRRRRRRSRGRPPARRRSAGRSRRNRSVTRTQPTSSETTAAGARPPVASPATSSVDPPPRSTTRNGPSPAVELGGRAPCRRDGPPPRRR